MENTEIQKEKLRSKLKGLRKTTPVIERIELSVRILQNLQKLLSKFPYQSIMGYYPVQGEVDNISFLKKALKSGKTVILPRVDIKNNVILPSSVSDFKDQLERGAFGISEPREICQQVNPEDIDIILVPGLGFDRRGYRIGFGKGFYDKFLSSIKRAITIGLAYSFQIVDRFAVDEHDIPVHIVITENEVIYGSEKTGMV